MGGERTKNERCFLEMKRKKDGEKTGEEKNMSAVHEEMQKMKELIEK